MSSLVPSLNLSNGQIWSKIYLGNSFEILQALEPCSIHMVVTSPPYWGLREYGTAKWQSGNPDCDHLAPPRGGRNPKTAAKQLTNSGTLTYQYTGTCKKCGATRIDYQLGTEPTPEEYVGNMVWLFQGIRRVLRDDGTVWLNLGDSYNGSGGAGGDYGKGGLKEGQPKYPGRNVESLKPKDLVGIPWRVALALQADGWYLRSDIIWNKPNPMPNPVEDRPVTGHEYVFLLTKNEQYFYDMNATKEPMSDATKKRDKNSFNGAFKGQFNGTPGEKRWKNGRPISKPHFYNESGRNRRTVWTIVPTNYSGAHFATMPPELAEICIRTGTSERGICVECGSPWKRIAENGWRPTCNCQIKHLPKWINYPRSEPADNASKETIDKYNKNCEEAKERQEYLLKEYAPIKTKPATVLDPFSGAATTGFVCAQLGRNYVGVELNPKYIDLSKKRLMPEIGQTRIFY